MYHTPRPPSLQPKFTQPPSTAKRRRRNSFGSNQTIELDRAEYDELKASQYKCALESVTKMNDEREKELKERLIEREKEVKTLEAANYKLKAKVEKLGAKVKDLKHNCLREQAKYRTEKEAAEKLMNQGYWSATKLTQIIAENEDLKSVKTQMESDLKNFSDERSEIVFRYEKMQAITFESGKRMKRLVLSNKNLILNSKEQEKIILAQANQIKQLEEKLALKKDEEFESIEKVEKLAPKRLSHPLQQNTQNQFISLTQRRSLPQANNSNRNAMESPDVSVVSNSECSEIARLFCESKRQGEMNEMEKRQDQNETLLGDLNSDGIEVIEVKKNDDKGKKRQSFVKSPKRPSSKFPFISTPNNRPASRNTYTSFLKLLNLKKPKTQPKTQQQQQDTVNTTISLTSQSRDQPEDENVQNPTEQKPQNVQNLSNGSKFTVPTIPDSSLILTQPKTASYLTNVLTSAFKFSSPVPFSTAPSDFSPNFVVGQYFEEMKTIKEPQSFETSNSSFPNVPTQKSTAPSKSKPKVMNFIARMPPPQTPQNSSVKISQPTRPFPSPIDPAFDLLPTESTEPFGHKEKRRFNADPTNTFDLESETGSEFGAGERKASNKGKAVDWKENLRQAAEAKNDESSLEELLGIDDDGNTVVGSPRP